MLNRTRYSRELRERIRKTLGNKCARCDRTEHLQFDLIVSDGGKHHSLNWRQRLNFYQREASRGNVQLLCPGHHVEKTLDELAAKRLAMINVTCPGCGKAIRVADQLRAPNVCATNYP